MQKSIATSAFFLPILPISSPPPRRAINPLLLSSAAAAGGGEGGRRRREGVCLRVFFEAAVFAIDGSVVGALALVTLQMIRCCCWWCRLAV